MQQHYQQLLPIFVGICSTKSFMMQNILPKNAKHCFCLFILSGNLNEEICFILNFELVHFSVYNRNEVETIHFSDPWYLNLYKQAI